MDIHQLKVFASAFKNRSFSRASEDLLLTQPTISSHIKTIEDELDCKLFDRIGKTIIPTKEAELLYPYAIELIEKFEDIKTAIGLLKEEIKGELVVGASTIPGTYIIPAFAAEFKKKYPDISFEVVIEDSKKITDMVLSHELLLGVVGAKMEQRKIEYLPFVEDELIFVSPPKLLDKERIALKKLTHIPFLLREKGSGTRKMMEKHLTEKGIGLEDLNVVAVLGSTDSVKEAVKAGLGASILSRVAVKGELKAGVVKEIKIEGLDMRRDFYIIIHKKRTLPKNYRAFADYLKGLPL
ncbi:MAG TPA: LysR family transcriptional regulator [Nitrospiraceae bacterium]|nr:LysR family transcriptional regulator [Nitrospiraceae bacterium]